jgi:hypothetical protein
LNSDRSSKVTLTNVEIITLAVYLLGGDATYIDTEDIAFKTNEIAPGRFAWTKYPEQINIHTVKTHLWDAKSPRRGALLLGSEKQGWILTNNGLALAKRSVKQVEGVELGRKQLSVGEKTWIKNERVRMLASQAFQKLDAGHEEEVTSEDAESFFRLNEYILGTARDEKIQRALRAFVEDPQLGQAVVILASKVPVR